MGLKVTVVQANPKVGDLRSNLEQAKSALLRHRDADVVVLPESFLCGYPADDLVLNSGFMNALGRTLVELADYVREIGGPALLIGAPEPGANLPFNAAHFIEPDGTRRIVRKLNLPNEGPFDERRTFAHGEERGPVPFRGYRLGIVICEEMWSRPVCGRLAGDGADVLIVINGSPYTRGKHNGERLAHARRRARENHLPLIYANLTGGQDELVFDGGSFALDADGAVLHTAKFFSDDEFSMTLHRPRSAAPTLAVDHHDGLSFEDSIEADSTDLADYTACVVALRDYTLKSGFEGVVIGISGGADSALAAAMAVDALGADRITGLTLPSAITSDIEDARLVAQSLGIDLIEMPIGAGVEVFSQGFTAAAERTGRTLRGGVTIENVQARLRMLHLMAWSNDQGSMLVTTGNKSECSVGYSTLYGDMAGGFNPLKDLYKTDVWRLMTFRNRDRPAEWMKGPQHHCNFNRIVAKVPTAGLAIGQTDEDKLGPYPVLDAFLRELVDEQVGPGEAVRRVAQRADDWLGHWSHRYDDVPDWLQRFVTLEYAERINRMVIGAEYKRRQSAPGPKIGPRAFGRDRRYPIVNGWV